MAPSKEVITGLSATVNTERGRKILRQGDALPADAFPGEVGRLRELGVFGVPKDRDADQRDEAEVLRDALAEDAARQGDSDAAAEQTGEPAPVEPEPVTENPEAEPVADGEPVDYAKLKAPQLKALLTERGIEFPKGVVANEKLRALLTGSAAAEQTGE